MMVLHPLPIVLLNIVTSQILIGHSIVEHGVDDRQHPVCYGYYGVLLADFAREPETIKGNNAIQSFPQVTVPSPNASDAGN